jgi:hypothetical protein
MAKKVRNMTTKGMAKRLFHPHMLEHAQQAIKEADEKAEPKSKKKPIKD